jgi:nucleoside-diphosphate-sugar epimerase
MTNPGIERILVTGATGFVGRPLCSLIEREGLTVRAAVRRAENAPSKPFPVREVVPLGDFDDATPWPSAVAGVDAVIHLAARVHVMRDNVNDPLAAFRSVNVGPTLQLARAAAQHGVKRLVFLSSIKVNGEATPSRPFSEADPCAPQDPYGVSKLEAEQGLREIARSTGLEVVIVRSPLVYGPQVKGNFLRLLSWAHRGVPLPLAGAPTGAL